jgi:hypothetical protein
MNALILQQNDDEARYFGQVRCWPIHATTPASSGEIGPGLEA